VFRILQANKRTMETNLIGRSTSDELVTEVSLVLGSTLILGYDCDQRLQHVATEEAYAIVTLLVFAEPRHDGAEVCKLCGGGSSEYKCPSLMTLSCNAKGGVRPFIYHSPTLFSMIYLLPLNL